MDDFQQTDPRSLESAILENDFSKVRACLFLGQDPNGFMKNGGALLLACQQQYEDIIQLLVASGAEVNVADENKKTPLILAAEAGLAKGTQVLILSDCPIDAIDALSKTALHRACQGGFVDIVKALVTAGANTNVKDFQGSTALHIATTTGEESTMRCLLTAGAEVNAINDEGKTPLRIVKNQFVNGQPSQSIDKLCKLLLEFGAKNEIGAKEDPQQTVIKGTAEVYGEKILVKDNGPPELSKAPSSQVVRLIADTGDFLSKNEETATQIARAREAEEMEQAAASKPAILSSEDGKTDLMHACYKGDRMKVSELLEAGAQVNSRDFNGVTALMVAALIGSLDIIKLLITHGANPNTKTPQGSTALHLAVIQKKLDAVKLLIKNGSNHHSRFKGMNCLMLSVISGAQDLVKYFLDLGIDPKDKNHKGVNAFDLAVAYKQPEIVKMIKDYLKDQKQKKRFRKIA